MIGQAAPVITKCPVPVPGGLSSATETPVGKVALAVGGFLHRSMRHACAPRRG